MSSKKDQYQEEIIYSSFNDRCKNMRKTKSFSSLAIQKFTKNLRQAIDLNQVNVVNKLLFKYSKLLNYHFSDSRDFLKALLSTATNCQNDKINKLLVNFVKFINFRAHDLKNYLNRAIHQGHIQWVEFLLRNLTKLSASEKKFSFLYENLFRRANIGTRKKMLALLIKYGMDTRLKNEWGENILHEFVDKFVQKEDQDAVEIAEMIINSGVPVDDVDNLNCSPLLISIYSENIELVSYLIQRGANVNHRTDELGYFPMLLASECNNNDIIDLLLSNGADINASSQDKMTALHFACLDHSERMISALIQKGANVSTENKYGMSPLSLLDPEGENYDQCVRIIIKELSKLSFESSPLSVSDMNLIQVDSEACNHFENCKNELDRMSNTKFYGPYTYYSVLKMELSMKKLACLTKNKEIMREIERNSRKFFNYKMDLLRIIEKAIDIKERSEIVVLRLNSVFKDYFPDVVIRKLADHLTTEDLPVI